MLRGWGRPAGTLKISDAVLTAKLDGVSQETSTFHRQLSKPVRTLTMSKTRAAKQTDVLSKTQLCLRMRGQRLGIAPASIQRGRCDACNSWQHGGRRRLAEAIKDGMDKIKSVWSFYFDTFTFAVLDAEEEKVLAREDDVEYLESLMKFVDDHRHSFPAMRSGLSEEKRTKLEAVEVTLLGALDEWMEDVRNYSWHLQLIRSNEFLWRKSWYAPTGGCFYMIWDHMAR